MFVATEMTPTTKAEMYIQFINNYEHGRKLELQSNNCNYTITVFFCTAVY